MTNENIPTKPNKTKKSWWPLVYASLLIYILIAGAYLRLVGLDWDIDQHLHPDERFLTMVEAALQPVEQVGDFFDTTNSSLNPNNRGYTFFVYGTFPIFIVRYVAEWLGQTGYSQVYLVGRGLSALSDLFVIYFVYLIATRLYDRRIGLLAAAFAAFSVLPIQQSHFFTVDTFTNFFMIVAMYLAVEISEKWRVVRGASSTASRDLSAADDVTPTPPSAFKIWANPILWPSILFGIILGMAVASKINAAPIAIILPGAAIIYLLSLPADEQRRQGGQVLLALVLAGLASLISFRIFQPYAFTGPGFLGFKPNPHWIETLSTLKAQTGGDVDFPPALQWARRPIWFSLQNMVIWGLGLPLGITAWAGFLGMGWRMLKGEWKKHAVIWVWTALYFAWQSRQWNSTMRYQLPIYPLLAIFGAWGIIKLWDHASQTTNKVSGLRFKVFRSAVLFVGGGVLVATAVWAFAFSRIYTRPHTRVAATRWLFQNMAGPVNLGIETTAGTYNQPLSFHSDITISNSRPVDLRFTALADGELTSIDFPHIVDRAQVENLEIPVSVTDEPMSADSRATAVIAVAEISAEANTQVDFDEGVTLPPGEIFYFNLEAPTGFGSVEICPPLTLHFQAIDTQVTQELSMLGSCIDNSMLPYPIEFSTAEAGILTGFSTQITTDLPADEAADQTLIIAMQDPSGDEILSHEIVSIFEPESDLRGAAYQIQVPAGIALTKGETYTLKFSLPTGSGAIAISSAAPANETSWDDGLPLRMDGYDPYGGIYQGGLNFEMYWDDNADKLERFVTTLDQADYLLITSSRQWGTTTRVPERHPLTTEYYDRLVGCPPTNTIEWCYNVAEPGMFSGNLGFELIETFQSNPAIGNFEINDQFSEEAFTVYDHPKVFVFQKSADFNVENVRKILGAVDLSKVIRITPKQADSHPGNLLLPSGRLIEQRQGGTWSDYFNYEALHNRFQPLGVIVWYLMVGLVGLITYPLVRYALPGLADRGYPLARITGLVLLSGTVWLAGSARVPFTRPTIGVVLLLMAAVGGYLAYLQRADLKIEWNENRKYFLLIEGLILTFFVVGLLIRFGNPDLWHPWKGGEKPMDFSYFNAVLKSTSFPPYDPWFAGGYINYYYYGFVLVGVLVKFLGIVPSFAYNLILPTLFSLIAIGAFSVAWNLVSPKSTLHDSRPSKNQLIGGLTAALTMAFFGNLGILQMFAQGFQKNVAPGGDLSSGNFFVRIFWTFAGFFKTITGDTLPIRMDEWYWNPSRVIGHQHGSPITEFPFFTFLYADLHAHLIALPVALLVVGWVVSVVRGRFWEQVGSRSFGQIGLGLLIGGAAIGALYPINLSDIYTYLPLGIVAVVYAAWGAVKVQPPESETNQIKVGVKRWQYVLLGIVGLAGLALLLYRPYWNWYGQGYSEIKVWWGTHTPFSEYFTHWGVFLFILVSWMFYETIAWMATTPVSALRKLEPYRGLIWSLLALIGFIVLILGIPLYPDGLPDGNLPVFLGIHIAWVVFPLVIWASVLLFRPGMSESKKIVLFFIGTGLVLTLMVETVVVSGDIGRMNTVFKFYFHTWTLFAVSSGAALAWLWQAWHKWDFRWRTIWQIALGFFIFSAALYPLLGSVAKISDRMTKDAPHTLDGMAYMQAATYHDEGVPLDLSQDYAAIRWLQDNVVGSPVIVEANSVEYRWGTRFTIYTGLPGVVGWNWHQRQQRTITPHAWVFERVDAVHEFYQTADLDWTQDFLARYDVRYIVYGQLEQAKYPGPGLEKFEAQDGRLWNEVFRDRETVIYEVIGGQ
jgi:YYY domain-containing protein